MNFKLSSIVFGMCTFFLTTSGFSQEVTTKQLLQEIESLKLKTQNLESRFEGNSKSGFQIAGYAAFDFKSIDAKSEFSGIKFAPIFHAKYGDIFQFEGELEFSVDEKGETVTELEYAAGTIFLSDYMGLQVGKFMSPIGQFVQNQHPSWINKLPTAPLGFGHDGAAPTSNVGMALRGGLPKIAGLRSNYVLFVANAPTFETAPDGDVIINSNGKITTSDAGLNIGARYALNIVSGMEVGLSASAGEISETLTTASISGSSAVDDIISRDYLVIGADLMYNINAFDIKAEYIQQNIGDTSLSNLEGGLWKALYAQVSYQFTKMPIEPVLRYAKYSNPDATKSQITLGVNYLLSGNLVAKFAYEINTNETTKSDTNSVLAQLAFGF